MNIEELQQAFEGAKKAGDFENAYKIEQQIKQAETQPVDYDVMQSIKNFPGSMKNLAVEGYQALSSPVETGKALMGAGQSGLEKLGRNFEEFYMGEEIAPTPGKEDAANAVADYYKGRYGSIDALKRTAMDDPAGLMLDASFAGSATKIPGIATVARAIDPINAIAKTGQTALKVIPKGTAAKLYDSAAKFSNRAGFDRNAAIRTALEEGFVPTQGGVRRVQGRIDILNAMLDELIVEAGKSGTKIPVNAVEAYLDQLRKTKGGFRLNRGKDLQKIDKLQEQWHKDLADLGGGTKITHVSPEFIQSFKKQAYEGVSYKKKSPGAKTSQVGEDFDKAMARAAKDEVARAVPEASEINKLLGELYNMQPELVSAAGRIDKHNLLGLDTGVKVGAGAAIGAGADATGIGAGLGMAISLLGNPRVKPRIAIALKRLRDGDTKWIDQNIGDPAVRAALVLAGRAQEIVGEPNDDAEQGNQYPQAGQTIQ